MPQGAPRGVRVNSKTKRVYSKTRFENQIQGMKKTRIPESSKRKNKTEKQYKTNNKQTRPGSKTRARFENQEHIRKLEPDSKTRARFENQGQIKN